MLFFNGDGVGERECRVWERTVAVKENEKMCLVALSLHLAVPQCTVLVDRMFSFSLPLRDTCLFS